VMAAGSSFAFKIAAKPLQIESWLLLTVYWNSSLLYLTVPAPTPYGIRFSHSTYRFTTRRTYV